MEWTGVCRWEFIQENDQSRTSEIQNTIKSSQGNADLPYTVFKKYENTIQKNYHGK